MRKVMIMLFVVGNIAMIAGFHGVESAYSQLRVPPTHVAALAAQPAENTVSQNPDADTRTAQLSAQVLPVQLAMPQQSQTTTPASPLPVPQNIAPQAEITPQVQPQLQTVMPQALPQPGMTPGMMGGAIIIPVVVPQYMTYNPPPVTMMVNRPAQLVIPQYPAPMMQPMMMPMQQPMYDPMAMQMPMMQQQPMMMQQPMMPMMQPQQPIPVKMILPDGSKVSIKHYPPGQFFKNVIRAVTP